MAFTQRTDPKRLCPNNFFRSTLVFLTPHEVGEQKNFNQMAGMKSQLISLVFQQNNKLYSVVLHIRKNFPHFLKNSEKHRFVSIRSYNIFMEEKRTHLAKKLHLASCRRWHSTLEYYTRHQYFCKSDVCMSWTKSRKR